MRLVYLALGDGLRKRQLSLSFEISDFSYQQHPQAPPLKYFYSYHVFIRCIHSLTLQIEEIINTGHLQRLDNLGEHADVIKLFTSIYGKD